MLFNRSLFAVFFVCFFLLFHFVARKPNHKLALIFTGSLLFYGSFNYKFIPLLLATILLDFYLARAIAATANERRRKLLLATSITSNIGVLCIFKYTNFFLASGYDLAHLFGSTAVAPKLAIVLPLGVSFYTFQSISYTVDVYRQTIPARKRVREFVAAVTFFPHLLAGPIVRSAELLPQFENIKGPTWPMMRRGFLLVALGLIKKTTADLLAGTSDAVFGAAGAHSMLQAWTGALAFVGQLYGDFAGYSDIAIGSALLLGFKLPDNFNLPYLATSPVDYWGRRMHISLSTWLRDYLYMPLVMRWRRHPYACMLVTWLLAGLWHGGNWTFVVYGAFWGVCLVGNHMINQWVSRSAPPASQPNSRSTFGHLARVAFMFYLVVLSLVIFRAPTVARAWTIVRELHRSALPSVFTYHASWTLLLVVAALVVCHLLDYLARYRQEMMERPVVLWSLSALGLVCATLLGAAGQPFIYFQF
jgi:D-alanyl-lipoteichoic acid acyltransferase DltB (MBOAT superfamily)